MENSEISSRKSYIFDSDSDPIFPDEIIATIASFNLRQFFSLSKATRKALLTYINIICDREIRDNRPVTTHQNMFTYYISKQQYLLAKLVSLYEDVNVNTDITTKHIAFISRKFTYGSERNNYTYIFRNSIYVSFMDHQFNVSLLTLRCEDIIFESAMNTTFRSLIVKYPNLDITDLFFHKSHKKDMKDYYSKHMYELLDIWRKRNPNKQIDMCEKYGYNIERVNFNDLCNIQSLYTSSSVLQYMKINYDRDDPKCIQNISGINLPVTWKYYSLLTQDDRDKFYILTYNSYTGIIIDDHEYEDYWSDFFENMLFEYSVEYAKRCLKVL